MVISQTVYVRFSIFVAFGLCFGTGDAHAQAPAQTSEPGAALFRGHCSTCHGLGGEGGRGPNLTTGEFLHGSTDNAILNTISLGIPGTEMPGLKVIDEHDKKLLVDYVKSLIRARAAVKVPGDPVAGKRLFEGKGACLQCHTVGEAGGRLGPDLSFIASRRGPDYLRESIVDPNKQVPNTYSTVKIIERDGQSQTGVLLNQDSYSIQFLDTHEKLVSRRVSDLREVRVDRTSLMPGYAGVFTAGELDDIVAYLNTLRLRGAN